MIGRGHLAFRVWKSETRNVKLNTESPSTSQSAPRWDEAQHSFTLKTSQVGNSALSALINTGQETAPHQSCSISDTSPNFWTAFIPLHPFIHPSVHSFIFSSVHPPLKSSLHLFIHSYLTHACIYLSTHSFIHHLSPSISIPLSLFLSLVLCVFPHVARQTANQCCSCGIINNRTGHVIVRWQYINVMALQYDLT